CTYKRMPNFDLLAAQYNASKTALLPAKSAYTPSITTFPACPSTVPTLKSIVWASDATKDALCPDLTQTTLCSGDTIFTGKSKGGNNSPSGKSPASAATTTATAVAVGVMWSLLA
ncbi:hypothetical protein As57867_007427, partial [Aphanomyces stellatus]